MTATLLAMAALPLLAALPTPTHSNPWRAPKNWAPTRWTLVGPFPSMVNGERKAFETDFLKDLGGESVANLNSKTVTGAKSVKAGPEGLVDLASVYGAEAQYCAAYAYAEWTEKKPRRYSALFGSDDGAKVWVNGNLVHSIQMDRGIDPEGDRFEVSAQSGVNRILIKIDQGNGGWGFSLRMLDDKGLAQAELLKLRQNLEFLQPGPLDGRFVLESDTFPTLGWRMSDAAKTFCNKPPAVRWFDAANQPVERATKPGRYTAVADYALKDGQTYRRYFTFFRSAAGGPPPGPWVPYNEPARLDLPWNDLGLGAAGDAEKAEFSRHVWRGMAEYLGSEGSASLLIRLNSPDLKIDPKEPTWLSSGFIVTAQANLDLRMGLENRVARPVAPPTKLDQPTSDLQPGTEAEAGLKPGTVEKLRALCGEWIVDDPNPFVVLVARHGKEVMREGFGGFTADSTFYPASIGKAIAGITISRAVDQGLFTFDTPLSEFFPEYRTGPASEVTFRHCFNHLTGLKGHATHAGLYNAALDNNFLTQEFMFAKPGTAHLYNGDGYNLAGKALEVTTGKTFFRTLYETMQKPMGESVTQFDNGFGDKFSARFLAKVGMMLIQDGAYGDQRFLSPGFVKKLTPYRVSDVVKGFPDANLEWGIGLTWMRDEGEPLGKNVFGHGAASASVWRVAPDHDLVVVIGRDGFKDYAGTGGWAAKFMKVLAEGLSD